MQASPSNPIQANAKRHSQLSQANPIQITHPTKPSMQASPSNPPTQSNPTKPVGFNPSTVRCQAESIDLSTASLYICQIFFPMKNPIESLRWRGLIQDIIPGTEERLTNEMTTGYVGFDPTADSLHIGSLVPILLLTHWQRAGHRPIALVGGATGMIGDPSGRGTARKLLDAETLERNAKGIRKQLEKFIDFSSGKKNAGLLLNNYSWMKSFPFIDFAREVGKHITVNYMMAKDSVKRRLSEESAEGMSFTEFSYPLLQGYDFAYLNEHYDCQLQMGGADQWGNMTTGLELLRKMRRKAAFAFTCPLLTRVDGNKFGKSEGENIWLDPEKTTPYAFYQFWLNTSDADAKKHMKAFTFLERETIESLVRAHERAPELRVLQKRLARELTEMVHGKAEREIAVKAAEILFGKSTTQALKSLDEKSFLNVFKGVPQAEIHKAELQQGISIAAALVEKSGFLTSKGEALRALEQNAISVNRKRVSRDFILGPSDLIHEKYLLLQRGKKNHFILRAI